MPDPIPEIQKNQLLVSSIGIIITFSAVLVALFKDWFWSKVKKPKLDAKIEMQAPYCTKTLAINQLLSLA